MAGYSSPQSRSSNMAISGSYQPLSSFSQSQNSIASGEDAYRKAMASKTNWDYGTGDIGSPVFKNVKQRYNASTLTPEYMGGLSKIVLGKQTVDLPNFIAQAIMNQEATTGGRANTAEKYFGISSAANAPYYSYATLQDQFNKMIQAKPGIAKADTALLRSTAWNDRSDKLSHQVDQLQRMYNKPGAVTEKINAEGQTVGGNNKGITQSLEALKRSQAKLGTPLSSRQSYFERLHLDSYIQDRLDELEGYKPTTSNLQIQEKVL